MTLCGWCTPHTDTFIPLIPCPWLSTSTCELVSPHSLPYVVIRPRRAPSNGRLVQPLTALFQRSGRCLAYLEFAFFLRAKQLATRPPRPRPSLERPPRPRPSLRTRSAIWNGIRSRFTTYAPEHSRPPRKLGDYPPRGPEGPWSSPCSSWTRNSVTPNLTAANPRPANTARPPRPLAPPCCWPKSTGFCCVGSSSLRGAAWTS